MSHHHTILKHKSWHVWNYDAIAKVEADEKKHEEEEAEKRARQRQIDSEARLARLRALSGKQAKVSDEAAQPVVSAYQEALLANPSQATNHMDPEQYILTDLDVELLQNKQHVNLFPEAEKKANLERRTNPDYMAEKKQRDDREAENFRGTFALGANELKKNKPWWLQEKAPESSPYVQKRIERKNDSSDPLLDLNKIIHKKHAHDQPQAPTQSRGSHHRHRGRQQVEPYYDQHAAQHATAQAAVTATSEITASEDSGWKKDKEKEKEKRGHKSKKRKRSHSSDSSDSSSSSSSSSSSRDKRKEKRKRRKLKELYQQKLAEEKKAEEQAAAFAKLREERMAREQAEQQRFNQIRNPDGFRSGRRGRGRPPPGGHNRGPSRVGPHDMRSDY